MHQGLGHEAPAVGTEVAAGVGHTGFGRWTHAIILAQKQSRKKIELTEWTEFLPGSFVNSV
jgi:hypothetical protein